MGIFSNLGKFTEKLKLVNSNILITGQYVDSRTHISCKCLIDGYEWLATPSNLMQGCGCPVCAYQIIVKGINDIATTHPHLVKYFVNEEDTYKYSAGSGIRVKTKCPICNSIKETTIKKLQEREYACLSCGDGVSYPSKFMHNLLNQFGLDFQVEKKFDWSNNKRYDFYIPFIKGIIEVNGMQHYEYTCRGRTLEEEQESDKIKKELALSNNIEHYIVIDCRYSNLDFIKNNIMNSKLAELFDISSLDWNRCHENSCRSLIKEACDLWNSGKNVEEIRKLLKRDKLTVRKYLKMGAKINLCIYGR